MTAGDSAQKAGRRDSVDAVVLSALASGSTWKEAAEVAGVSESTVARRCGDPGFRSELEELQQDVLSRVTSRLAQACTVAVDALAEVAADAAVSPKERIAAACALLDRHQADEARCEIGRRLDEWEDAFAVATPVLRAIEGVEL